MAKNIPSNENQRPATKTTLPSKALNQDRRPKKVFPRQKRWKKYTFTKPALQKMLKGLLYGKEGKEKQRGIQVGKNGNE